MAKDYYATLGIEKTATPEEIKKAFRKKALEHHPDRAEDKETAEAKFKEINEAYAVLSDEQKRRQYDMFGSDRFRQQFSQDDIFRGANVGNIEDILGDMGFGGDVFSRIFGRFSGRGRPGQQSHGFEGGGFPGFGGSPHAQQQPRAISHITVGFHEAVNGSERSIAIGPPGGPSRNLKIKIPPGTRDGTQLRLKGQGGAVPPGGQPEDLYLEIRVAPHSRFSWRGDRDLEIEVAVDAIELMLGTSIAIPTLQFGDKRIKIPAGTQPGTSIRLKGFGVPGSDSRSAGDLYAVIRVSIRENLTDEQKSALEALRLPSD